MKKTLFVIVILIINILLLTLFINVYMIKKTENKIVSLNNDLDDIDAILILGCKAYSDYPSEMLALRLDKGIEVYKKLKKKIIISGDHGQDGYDEVNVMRDYLVENNIPMEDIFMDHAGFNTYDSIYRAKYIFDVKKMIVITQEYHLYRALFIADKLDIDALGIKADNLPYRSIMLKNEIREIFSRDKNFFKALIKPQSKYLGNKISLDNSGLVTEG